MLERIATDGPPDVLLLDWVLPELSGLELCQFLRQRFDEGALPILLVTAFSSGQDVAAALEAGANDFVRKPFDDTELHARVAGALRTKRLFARARLAEHALDHERVRLRESEVKFRRLAESGIIGISIMDLTGNVLEANDTLLVMVGHTRADLAAGRVRMRELTASESAASDERAVRELLEHGVCKRYEKVLERPDGSQIVVLQCAALLNRETAIAYFLDVTEHRGLEADRTRLYDAERRARGEAERASLMKDEFLATVSHELRTPLNAIVGWSHLARLKEKGPELDRALDTIERNARIQSKLIDDILDISRIISGKVRLELSQVDVAQVVAETLEAVRPAASAKGVELRNEATPGFTVLGDPSRLHQIVWNLVTNAIKFTQTGGFVRVAIEQVEERIRLIVQDNGRGIGADFLPHVFDRFRQADATTTRTQGGLGLGLAIVQHLTEQHGGRAFAKSAGPGQGATFLVELPVSNAELRSSVTNGASPEPPSIRVPVTQSLLGLRVLLVDDEMDSRDFLAALLGEHGAEVVSAGSAKEAFAAFQAKSPDVVVSDIAMANEDGYQLVRRIRALPADRGGHVPAIALTAYARLEDERRSLTEGFQAHLTKPVDIAGIVRAVASLRDRNVH
jgi:PAS domain S-box-containing protein